MSPSHTGVCRARNNSTPHPESYIYVPIREYFLILINFALAVCILVVIALVASPVCSIHVAIYLYVCTSSSMTVPAAVNFWGFCLRRDSVNTIRLILLWFIFKQYSTLLSCNISIKCCMSSILLVSKTVSFVCLTLFGVGHKPASQKWISWDGKGPLIPTRQNGARSRVIFRKVPNVCKA